MEVENAVGTKLKINNMINQKYMDIYFWRSIRGEKKDNWGSNQLKYLQILEEISSRSINECKYFGIWRTDEKFKWLKLINKFWVARNSWKIRRKEVIFQTTVN